MNRPTFVWPGPARLTLVLLAVVPAAMAYPWPSTRDRWVLGVAVAVALVLLGWWRGRHLTTIVRRRLAMLGGDRAAARATPTDVRTTALLRVADPGQRLPLPLIAGYLNRYGIRADAIRLTSFASAAEGRASWIGLTISAADNLAALQARSPRIPLHEVAEVAVRRLADHLREDGWETTVADHDEVPALFSPSGRQTWRALWEGEAGYVAAYRVSVDDALPQTLAAIWSQPAAATWSAVEIADGPGGRTVAAGCAFRTAQPPGTAAPLAGLVAANGNHRTALRALHPGSAQRLDGHTAVPDELLARLAAGTGARHAAV